MTIMQNSWADILNCIAVIFFVICWALIVLRFIKSRYANVRTVKAVITDKYKYDPVSHVPGTFNNMATYTVVFSVGTKKLAFGVSEYSFANFRVGEKGTLTYKGGRLIGFK